jgi:ATP-dependent exoDNAse (exonuclease V) beta subunit
VDEVRGRIVADAAPSEIERRAAHLGEGQGGEPHVNRAAGPSRDAGGVPPARRLPAGSVLDLAFEEAGGWTVVDFKTDAEIAGELARYRRQVGLYASVVAQATGKSVTAVLMRL